MAQQLPSEIQRLQIIVVDDGSSDETELMVAKEFPNVLYIKQANLGVSAARNAGIKAADGDWLGFLDSDDEWLPEKVSKQCRLITESQLLVCHTEEIWIRDGVRVNQMKKHAKSGGWIFKKCLPLCVMSPSSILIHRSVLEQTGTFDEALQVCEDYDLWLRITSRYEVAFVSEPCVKKYGGHADQLSGKHWGMDRYRVIALEKALAEGLQPELHHAALDTLHRKLGILMQGAQKHQNTELIKECLTIMGRWPLAAAPA